MSIAGRLSISIWPFLLVDVSEPSSSTKKDRVRLMRASRIVCIGDILTLLWCYFVDVKKG